MHCAADSFVQLSSRSRSYCSSSGCCSIVANCGNGGGDSASAGAAKVSDYEMGDCMFMVLHVFTNSDVHESCHHLK